MINTKTSAAIATLAVIKRDGRVAGYDFAKIITAIMKCAVNVEGNLSTERLAQVTELAQRADQEISRRFSHDIKIYEIQSIVEHTLIENKEKQLAAAYIHYRSKRDIERLQATDVNQSIHQLLSNDKQVVNENANKDSKVFNTLRDLTAGSVAKATGLQMLPKHVANAHLKGDLHYHDLDYHPYSPMTNCCLIDFKSMFENGFKIGNAEVEQPKSINTATAQMAQIIANVASSQYGGCSADRTDELLAPYAEMNYNKHLADAAEWITGEAKQQAFAWQKTEKDIYDAMQSLEYEINTLYSSNGQTPFTTLGFGLGTGRFEREIQKAILQVRLGGLGKEQRTAIFPKLVFTLRRGVNLEPTDLNYDIKQLAIECSTKRMYPDILSYDKIVELTGSFKTPMGCRSFLQGWTNEAGEEVNSGRMNLGVVTLNLPRIALQSGGDLAAFWELFAERMALVKDALIFRLERVKEALPENAPILYKYGAFGQRLADGDSVDALFNKRRATISIGYIGLYEAGTLFYGPNWEANAEAKAFTLQILREMKALADAWREEYGYHFSVYSTPSESLTDRFCRIDKQKFGVIEHITAKDYYTNSFHYDVRKQPTPFAKIDFEKDYPKYCAGGFIHYCEYPVMRQNPKALEAVWDYAYDRIGYLGTNTPIDHCYECGHDGEFEPTAAGFECPECQNTNPDTCDVVKRTCGYLGNPQQRPMVHGRHLEIAARKKHVTDERDERRGTV